MVTVLGIYIANRMSKQQEVKYRWELSAAEDCTEGGNISEVEIRSI